MLSSDETVHVPREFATESLPRITEIAEIHVSIAMFRLGFSGNGFDHPVDTQRLMRDRALRSALRDAGNPREAERKIRLGIDLALARGTLCAFQATIGIESIVWYYVNTPVNRALVAAMTRGSVAPPPAVWVDGAVPTVEPERPNVFRLYEQNVGLLSPLIADRLIQALELYPTDWIHDAIDEAVAYNRRNWRYIQRILENWTAQGRGEAHHSETHRRRDSNPLDPDQYKNGRYLDRTGRG